MSFVPCVPFSYLSTVVRIQHETVATVYPCHSHAAAMLYIFALVFHQLKRPPNNGHG